MTESNFSRQVVEFFEGLLQINGIENVLRAAMTVLVASVFGVLIYFTYKLTCKPFDYQREFGLVLIVVPIVVSILLTVIGTNIARAFSLAGALSIIRYRSTLVKPKEIVFIFFGMGTGFITGCFLYLPALVFVLITCVVIIVYTAFTLERGKNVAKTLTIAVPENINYDGLFDEILEKFTSSYALNSIRIISGGAVTELQYHIKIKDVSMTKELLDEVRVLNQNFKIQLTQFATQ
ncbi:MAG: DUF4956 domain-containing protein [Clostridiaceae bacterium]|nr:DUF4956 domain-containing protein [Clostridiaceae bacterium]